MCYLLLVGIGSDWLVCVVDTVQTEDVSDWPDLWRLRRSPYRETVGCSARDMILFSLDLFSAPETFDFLDFVEKHTYSSFPQIVRFFVLIFWKTGQSMKKGGKRTIFGQKFSFPVKILVT